MHHILIATDFTPQDKQAFGLACQIARAWRAKLLIAHIDDSSPQSSENLGGDLDPNKRLFGVFPRDLGISYDYIQRHGRPAAIIRQIAEEKDVDLIVLGTHGRQGIERMFSGSIAEMVLRDANCPVVTIRRPSGPTARSGKGTKKGAEKILVATDFSAHSYAALDFASLLAQSLGAVITVLYVDDSEAPAKPSTGAVAADDGGKHHKVWNQLIKVKPTGHNTEFTHKLLVGPAAETITEFVNEHDFDYVVLGTHGRSGIGRVLMGSVAEHVVRTANCPVFTVKPDNKRHPVLTSPGQGAM